MHGGATPMHDASGGEEVGDQVVPWTKRRQIMAMQMVGVRLPSNNRIHLGHQMLIPVADGDLPAEEPGQRALTTKIFKQMHLPQPQRQ